MKIQVTVGRNGLVSALLPSTTEDLWHDFVYFKAKAHEMKQDEQLYRRYQRSAVFALFGYLEAIVNRWCVDLVTGPKGTEAKSTWERYKE